jgi:hypothetical protein
VTSPSEHGREQPWLVWRWPAALGGATFALPAAVVVPFDARLGVALAVGVIPAAVPPLPPQRRDRLVIVVFGAFMGISVLVGSLLATTPWLAVAGILVPTDTRRRSSGRARRNPPGPTGHRPLDGRCSATACAWDSPGRSAPPSASPLHFEHVGWPTAAALLVMRPAGKTLELRALGRAASVCAGAAATIGFLALHPSHARQTATVGSRWYITPAFTTSLVFLLLLLADPTQAGERFGERMGETLLGVAVAHPVRRSPATRETPTEDRTRVLPVTPRRG